MLKKIDNNISYVLKKQTPKLIKYWLIIIIISLIIIFVILLKYKYYKCFNYVGYVKKVENFLVYIYVKEENISSINDSKIFIDNKEYSFNVMNISDDYYLVDNDNYYLMELDIPLEPKYLINNNIINIIVKEKQTTLLKEIGGKIYAKIK